MLCPNCGRETEELYGGFCAECASSRLAMLKAPEVLAIERCVHCGRQKEGSRWVTGLGDPMGAMLTQLRHALTIDAALDEVAVEFDAQSQDAANLRVEVRLTAAFHGVPVHRSAAVQVRLRKTACPDCSRRFGGYFESILQIRGSSERKIKDAEELYGVAEAVLSRFREGEREGAYFSDVEKKPGGLDLKVGSKEIARSVARELSERWGAEITESTSLVGRGPDGNDLLRSTFLIRLPPYQKGDFVATEEGLFKVVGTERRRILLWDLKAERSIARDPHRVKSLKVVGTASDQREAVVVSRRGKRLQVLDPLTMATVDLEVPEDLSVGETLPVFRHDERLWPVIPRDHAKA